jgi:hypothetical protein
MAVVFLDISFRQPIVKKGFHACQLPIRLRILSAFFQIPDQILDNKPTAGPLTNGTNLRSIKSTGQSL